MLVFAQSADQLAFLPVINIHSVLNSSVSELPFPQVYERHRMSHLILIWTF